MTRLLVVDDEEKIISMLKRVLSGENFEVDGAVNEQNALELMERHLYPIVILDIKFPDTSGTVLLKEFKKQNPLVNIVILTGYASIENIAECMGSGAVDCFTKPLDMDEFVEAIQRIDQKLKRWERTLGIS